jgi:hypothetical protein
MTDFPDTPSEGNAEIEHKDYADLASSPAIQHLISDGIEAVNATLASYESSRFRGWPTLL